MHRSVQGSTWRHRKYTVGERVSPCLWLWCCAGRALHAATGMITSLDARISLFPSLYQTRTPPNAEDADSRQSTVRQILWILIKIFIWRLGSWSSIKQLLRSSPTLHSPAYTNLYLSRQLSRQRNRILLLSPNSRLVSDIFHFRSYHVFC